MKKLISLLLVIAMMLSLCACGADKDSNPSPTESTTTTTEATSTTIEDTTGTVADTTDIAEDTTTDIAEDTTTEIAPESTAAESTGEQDTTQKVTTNTTKKDTGKVTTAKQTTAKKTTVKATKKTTKKTTVTTTTKKTTKAPDNRPELKILSIGHSFSVDAMKTYMWELFNAAGYKVTLAYLYFPGCSLERQYHYITSNQAKYQRYAKNRVGGWVVKQAEYDQKTNEVTKDGVRALDALWDEDWDIVTFQPSPDYGAGNITYDCKWGCGKKVNDYDHFNQLVAYVKDTLADPANPNGPNTDVKFYYHLTWAFSEDCELWSYQYSNFNQMQMYNDFLNATQTYVVPNGDIEGVIPCITSIQNVRTSWMGDTFNEKVIPGTQSDGYHLNDKGDFVAALTWVSYFTGVDATKINYKYGYEGDEFKAMAEAVNNAIKNPLQVTQSSYTKAP